jgi:hypothetical protein
MSSCFTLTHSSYKYWEINPDQASDDPAKSPNDPIHVAQSMLVGGKQKSEDTKELRSDVKVEVSPV